MSITDPQSYMAFYQELLSVFFSQEREGVEEDKQEIIDALLSALDHHPYFLVKVMICSTIIQDKRSLEGVYAKLEKIV